MKAYDLSNKKIARAFVRNELKDVDYKARRETAEQLMAMVLYTFDKNYGWKKKRLRRLFDSVNDMFKIMDSGCYGKTFNAVDIVDYVKKHYDIDLEEEIKIEVKEEK